MKVLTSDVKVHARQVFIVIVLDWLFFYCAAACDGSSLHGPGQLHVSQDQENQPPSVSSGAVHRL